MQEPTVELSGLDLELFARQLIDDADAYSGAANTIAQLRSQIPLNLLPAEVPDAGKEGMHHHLGPLFGEEAFTLRDRVAGLPLAHAHFIRAAVRSSRCQNNTLA